MMKYLLLLIATLSLATGQVCYWSSCSDCLGDDTSGKCNWCDSTAMCFDTSSNPNGCPTNQIDSKDMCPVYHGIDNKGTFYLAAFVPGYLLLTVLMVIIHYIRVHVIEPVIDFHVNRRGIMDFSALLDDDIEQVVHAVIPGNDQLLWADVSLKISRWRHMVPALVSFVIGIVVLSVLPHSSSLPSFFLPIFVILAIPCIYQIYIGMHQLLKKRNYTDVYLLTTSGAVIVRSTFKGRKVFHWPYTLMVNIHSEHVMYKVASVYFAESWNPANTTTLAETNDRIGSSKAPFSDFTWRRSRVGFENIVKAKEVEELLREQITQLSPDSLRNVAFTM